MKVLQSLDQFVYRHVIPCQNSLCHVKMKSSPPTTKQPKNDTVVITIQTCDSKTCSACGNCECPALDKSQERKPPKSAVAIREPTKNQSTIREPTKNQSAIREPTTNPSAIQEPSNQTSPQREPSKIREPSEKQLPQKDPSRVVSREPSKQESQRIDTVPEEPSRQESRRHTLVLPILPNRIHGPGCVMEINVLEKHDNACIFKKTDNEFRNNLDDRVGSYDCIGRLAFRTCDKRAATQPAPLVIQEYDGSRHVVDKADPSRSRMIDSPEGRNYSQTEPAKSSSSRNPTREPSTRSKTSQKGDDDLQDYDQELAGSRVIQQSRILPKKKESQFNSVWEEDPNDPPEAAINGGMSSIRTEEVSRPSSNDFTINDYSRSTINNRSGSKSRTNTGAQSNRAISFNSRVASKSKSDTLYEEGESFGDPRGQSSGISTRNPSYHTANDTTQNTNDFQSGRSSMNNTSDFQSGRSSMNNTSDFQSANLNSRTTNASSTDPNRMELMAGSSYSQAMSNADDLDNSEDNLDAGERFAVMTLLTQPKHLGTEPKKIRGDSSEKNPISNLIFDKVKMQALEDALFRQKELNSLATSTKPFPVLTTQRGSSQFAASEDTITSLNEGRSSLLGVSGRRNLSRTPLSGASVNTSSSISTNGSKKSKFMAFFKRKQKSQDNDLDEDEGSSKKKERRGCIEESPRIKKSK